MYVLSSRVTRVRWARSWRSSNHHQLVRVSKRLDSSVPRTRGYGSKDEPLPVTASVDSSQGGRIASPTESEDTRASEKSTRITADTTFLQQGHKPRSEENKQFDPGGTVEKERRPALERGCNSTFFFCGELGGSLLCFCFVSALCVLCFPNYFYFPGDHVSAKLKDMRGDADQGSSR